MSGLGARLKAARLQLAMSRADLAQAAGVSATAVYMWEEKGVRPQESTLVRVSRALDVSPRYLLRGKEHTDQLASTTTDLSRAIKEARRMIAESLNLSLDRVVLRVEVILTEHSPPYSEGE